MTLMDFRKYFLLTLCLLLTSEAGSETIDRDVTGYGASPREAISDALVEVLKQTSGVAIDAEQAQITIRNELHASTDDSEVNLNTYAQTRAGKINYRTAGVIQQYEILSVEQGDNGLYEANLRVQTEVYRTPGFAPGNRRSLAVLRPHMLQDRYQFSGYSVRQDELSRRLQQALITELTQARRFSVMDRNFRSEFLREKKLLAGPDTAMSEYAKIGQVLGVDYMIVGTVTDAELNRASYKVATLGETGSTNVGRFRFEYRIIVMATRQVKWSGVSDLDFSGKRIPGKLVNKGEALADYMISAVARDIGRQVLNNIYPLQVVKISTGGELYLNQGGITVRQGERYTLFGVGEEIFDPYTGELLGREETPAGLAEIVRVNPKYSVARLVEGDRSGLVSGMLLRFPEATRKAKQKKPIKVQVPAW